MEFQESSFQAVVQPGEAKRASVSHSTRSQVKSKRSCMEFQESSFQAVVQPGEAKRASVSHSTRSQVTIKNLEKIQPFKRVLI